MSKKSEITAIVPVKLNSDRVKSKNLRRFAGSNLLKIKIRQLKKTNCFRKIIVSSEAEKILKIAKQNTNTQRRCTNYLKNNIKEKQNKNI